MPTDPASPQPGPDDLRPDVPADQHADQAARTFKLLTDPTRIKILWVLQQGERSVNDLAERVGANATVVSQHLAKLRLAGLVTSRREATFAYYSTTSAHVHNLLMEALAYAEHGTDLDPSPRHEHRYGSRRV
ncbi:MAG: metalloregulator ArsR/SmtB family transcription factor [Ornithinimicrobium sp.]|uniref:ArsR/SmtB family transcription factor n=1 Tax=Ornithinimicrobium sp. TaxID=1977084 RepID=UPI0026DF46D6|nr:metalloregulator ArsR/SmtB family transcription factor [Ornithinimicrobium sp.]MDO5740310.1 metalloregulator ArsR/SmtB family transcription factor [Ornithinimicrobium sp.]